MTLEEITKAKEELRNELNGENVDLDAIENKIGELEAEERRKVAEAINEREINADKLGDNKEERKMSFTIASPEYRSAWAKKMLNYGDELFTEDEKRALGDAITTTSTTFVQSTADTQGINNGGLFIPTQVRMDIMEIIYKSSPFLRDVKKLEVAGNVDLPYLYAADDAEWYAELSSTKNEGQEYKKLQLTGYELAKDVEVTWKLEAMAVDSFLAFIVEEIADKMGKALAHNVIYGDGSNKPTGALNGLTAITTGTDPIETAINTFKSLGEDAKRGAKCYISQNVAIAITQMKDNDNRYMYLAGLPKVALFDIEVDPFLSDNDILVGNAKNYILNTVAPMRLDKESQLRPRRVLYGAYAIYDGKPRPSCFAKGVWTPSTSI